MPTPEPILPQPAVSRKLFWLVGGLAVLALGVALGVFSAKFFSQSTTQPQISTYQDCLAAKGSIVQESYPATCVTVSGQRFVQPLTDEEKQGLQPPDPYREPTSSAATANWKTYSNNTYQFSFKYPIEWQLTCSEPKGNDWLDTTICQLTAPNTQLDHGYLSKGAYVAVGVSKPTPNYSSLKEYVTDSANRGYISLPKTYNNISGYLLSPPESPKTYSNFVFESNGYIININWVPTDENNPNYLTINQILSTFKFLN